MTLAINAYERTFSTCSYFTVSYTEVILNKRLRNAVNTKIGKNKCNCYSTKLFKTQEHQRDGTESK